MKKVLSIIKKIIIVFVILFIVIISVALIDISNDEKMPFNEEDIVGKNITYVVNELDENKYKCNVYSETGYELSNNFDIMDKEILDRWYVVKCNIDHSEKIIDIYISTDAYN